MSEERENASIPTLLNLCRSPLPPLPQRLFQAQLLFSSLTEMRTLIPSHYRLTRRQIQLRIVHT